MAENFYKYTADELMEKMLSEPNWEYFAVIMAVNDDRALLNSSIEILLANPLYVLSYTLRGTWKLLYDPGWGHGRWSTLPFSQLGRHFPFGGVTTYGRSNIGDLVPDPALKEASFLPRSRQPPFVKNLYYRIETLWYVLYHPVTKILCLFAIAAWISTAIGLLNRLFSWSWLERWSKLCLSEQVLAASLGISLFLLESAGLTALLVDPYYRYDFSLLMLKFMLAGVGGAVIANILFRVLQNISMYRVTSSLNGGRKLAEVPTSTLTPVRSVSPTLPLIWPRRHPRIVMVFLAMVAVIGFFGWGWQLYSVAVIPPPPGTIEVTAADYGGNCGAPKNNALQVVRSNCSGKTRCSFHFDGIELGDPARSCSKDLRMEWKCAPDGQIKDVVIPAQVPTDYTVLVACD